MRRLARLIVLVSACPILIMADKVRNTASSQSSQLCSMDFTRFHRQISTSSSKLLECQWAQLVQANVPADSIVETLNIIKYV